MKKTKHTTPRKLLKKFIIFLSVCTSNDALSRYLRYMLTLATTSLALLITKLLFVIGRRAVYR